MFAIVETGGKQYPVELGRYLDVELLDIPANENVTLDKVVMIVDGDNSKVGQPYLKDTTVIAKVLKHDKDKKVIVYKQHFKKGYRKKQGHRQQFTRIMIEEIAGIKAPETVTTKESQPAKVKKSTTKEKTEAKVTTKKTATAKAEKATETKKAPVKKTTAKKAPAKKAEETKTEE